MQHLRDHFGVRHINFYDDLFAASSKRVEALYELPIAKSLGMHFNCARHSYRPHVRHIHISHGICSRFSARNCALVRLPL